MKSTLAVAAVLLSTAAHAADLPVLKASPMTQAWSWSGLYLGLNGGYGFNGSAANISGTDLNGTALVGTGLVPPGLKVDAKGAVFGGQAGYNWQAGYVVFGLETDLQWSGIKGNSQQTLTDAPFNPTPNALTTTATQAFPWFGTARGRLGLAFDHTLIYGTGGLAYGEVNDAVSIALSGPVAVALPGSAAMTSTSRTGIGWVAGLGLEQALGNNWVVRAEWLHVDLGSTTQAFGTTVTAPNGNKLPFNFSASQKDSFDLVRAGLSYKF